MRRVKFTFETPTWFKPGAVIFVADDADIEAEVRRYAGPEATITIIEARAATSDEIARREAYERWLKKWEAAAREGKAGRHMAGPR